MLNRTSRGYTGPNDPTQALTPLGTFSPNPGNLTGHIYVPPSVQVPMPLVVVLHGCTQSGEKYARDSGWLALAERERIMLLVPQQQRSNNANLCFNWFEPGDLKRGEGEPASIHAMIATVASRYDVDQSKIYVTGLSAGAAMAGVMLATYPEVFAGGGLIAGLPYGVAQTVAEAFQAMQGARKLDSDSLGALITGSSAHAGPWPRVTIWHGSADATVSPRNAEAISAQWVDVHGPNLLPPSFESFAGWSKRQWKNDKGEVAVESVEIAGMGHGTPISSRAGGSGGHAAPYVLDVGISSSEHIAGFWNLVPVPGDHAAASQSPPEAVAFPPKAHRISSPNGAEARKSGIRQVIEDALRKAGLL